jgi:hypothetical protein
MPSPSLRYEVHFRAAPNENGAVAYGVRRITGEELAVEAARAYDVPGAWALVVHPITFTRVAEFGTRFAELHPATNCNAVQRKPPARAESAHVQLQLQLQKGGAT